MLRITTVNASRSILIVGPNTNFNRDIIIDFLKKKCHKQAHEIVHISDHSCYQLRNYVTRVSQTFTDLMLTRTVGHHLPRCIIIFDNNVDKLQLNDEFKRLMTNSRHYEITTIVAVPTIKELHFNILAQFETMVITCEAVQLCRHLILDQHMKSTLSQMSNPSCVAIQSLRSRSSVPTLCTIENLHKRLVAFLRGITYQYPCGTYNLSVALDIVNMIVERVNLLSPCMVQTCDGTVYDWPYH